MKILYISPSLSQAATGIFEVERCLALTLNNEYGASVSAVGLDDAFFEQDKDKWENCSVKAFPVKGPKFFGYSPALKKFLSTDRSEVAHLHAMWMYTSVAVYQWSQLHGKPYIVTPNGMLETRALANSGWKKKLASAFYERRMLDNAACIQANTLKERDDIRAFGLKNPICVIPNGVYLPDSRHVLDFSTKTDAAPLRILFLGRIHPKKGLSNLIEALVLWKRKLPTRKIQLVIAGRDQGGHLEQLQRQAKDGSLHCTTVSAPSVIECELDADIMFSGIAYGEEKNILFNACDLFALPSYSEGQPMSVLEAWAFGMPVLMTEHCNLMDGFDAGAAVRIQTDSESILEAFEIIASMSVSELEEIGKKGRRLVQQQYSWTTVAGSLLKVYKWVAGQGEKPETVD